MRGGAWALPPRALCCRAARRARVGGLVQGLTAPAAPIWRPCPRSCRLPARALLRERAPPAAPGGRGLPRHAALPLRGRAGAVPQPGAGHRRHPRGQHHGRPGAAAQPRAHLLGPALWDRASGVPRPAGCSGRRGGRSGSGRREPGGGQAAPRHSLHPSVIPRVLIDPWPAGHPPAHQRGAVGLPVPHPGGVASTAWDRLAAAAGPARQGQA